MGTDVGGVGVFLTDAQLPGHNAAQVLAKVFITDNAVVLQSQLVVGHPHKGHLLSVIPGAQKRDVALFGFAENQVVNRLPSEIQSIDAGAEVGDLP